MNNQNILNCSKLLINKKLTIAFAESATAGRMSSEFSMVKNAGKFLKGGLVCYDASLKEELLNVPKKLIDKCTPESAEVTKAITEGLTQLIEADIHVGVTGLPAAGGSETEEKPVGTMFIYALLNKQTLFSERIIFEGNEEEIILNTIYRTAELLTSHLK
jgi:nicotinamide-nucleotide amidase